MRRKPSKAQKTGCIIVSGSFLTSRGGFLLQDKVDAALVRSLLAGLSVCSAAQVKSLYWLNELEAAEIQARKHYRRIEELSFKVTLDQMQPRLAHVDNSNALALGLLRDV